MSLQFARCLTGRKRTRTHQSNRVLGATLALVAGAIHDGGFLAVQQYDSHTTGIVSSMADNLALGYMKLELVGQGGLLSFMLGAACQVVMVHQARRKVMRWPRRLCWPIASGCAFWCRWSLHSWSAVWLAKSAFGLLVSA